MVLTRGPGAAGPSPAPLPAGPTRAPPVALPLHPTIPVTSTNPTMLSRAQDGASAPAAGLRSSAVAFTPGGKVHMTEDEDELVHSAP